MGKSRKTIHVIQSVKGGCGKTAFALRKGIELSINKLNENKVIYIDADVHASETYNMLKPGKEKNYLYTQTSFKDKNIQYLKFYENEKHDHYLNTYIHPYMGYYSKLNEIIYKAEIVNATLSSSTSDEDPVVGSLTGYLKFHFKPVKPDPDEKNSDNCRFDFIFVDPSKRGRDVFESQFQSSGKSAIGVGLYLAKMRNLLMYLINSDYTDIIVDMPPGSDTFSWHLTEEIIDLVSEKENKCSLNMYYVANDDINHMRSAIHAAVENLHVMRSSSPVKNYFVYNKGRENNDYGTDYESREQIIKGSNKPSARPIVGLSTLFDDTRYKYELSRLEYIVFSRDQIYYDSLHSKYINNSVCFDATNSESKIKILK